MSEFFAFFPKKCCICGRKVWLEFWDGDSVTIRCKDCMIKWELESLRTLLENLEKEKKEEHKKIWGAVCG